MAYLRSYQALSIARQHGLRAGVRGRTRGDPFLGAVIGAAARFVPGVGPLVGRAVSAVSGALSRRAPIVGRAIQGAQGILRRPGVGGVIRGAGAAVGAGVAYGAGAEAISRVFDAGGGRGMGGARRRRMNPTNVKALRRAISRVHSFTKLAKDSGCIAVATRVKRKGKKCL